MNNLFYRTRINKGLTIRELSLKSNVSVDCICNIEKGKNSPTLEIFGKLAKALNISLHISTIDEELTLI